MLAKLGVRPGLTMGHSIGEIAAAEAAGALTLDQALEVVFHRSRHQEMAQGVGGMAAIIGPREAALGIVGDIAGLSVATQNSWRCVVAAGPAPALDTLAERTRDFRKLRVQRLDLNYPFHTALMDPAKRLLLQSLAGLKPSAGTTPFLSTIDGALIRGEQLDAGYWWRNIREPVLFDSGLSRALELGKRIFLEIGPRPVLRGHMRDIIEQADVAAFIEGIIDDRATDKTGEDPFERVAMRLLSVGAALDVQPVFGPDPGPGVDLPAYPWRRIVYHFGQTQEASGAFNTRPVHPLIGARTSGDTLEWRADLDPELEPALADHRIQGQTLLPGAAFVEMALAIARDWKKSDVVEIAGLEILHPLIFVPNASREIFCRVSASTATFEIMSRPRLSPSAFVTHARGKIRDRPRLGQSAGSSPASVEGWEARDLYAAARRLGLEFGGAYRKLERAWLDGDAIEVALNPEAGDGRFALDPARLDSCFHGLVLLFDRLGAEAAAYLPVRFEAVRHFGSNAPLAGARIKIRRADERAVVADFNLVDDQGLTLATLTGGRYQPARAKVRATLTDVGLTQTWIPATADLVGSPPALSATVVMAAAEGTPASSPEALLIEGWASAAALELARDLAVDGVTDLDELVLSGRLPEERRRWAADAFETLCESRFLTKHGSGYRLTGDALPPAQVVLESLATQYPERSPELLLAAHVGAILRAFGAGDAPLVGPSLQACEGFRLRSNRATAAATTLRLRLESALPVDRVGTAPRILLIGANAAAAAISQFAASRNAPLTILDEDERRLERARRRFAQDGEITFISAVEGLTERGFDIVASAGGLSDLCGRRDALDVLAAKCAAGASIIAIEPAPSRFANFTLGLANDVSVETEAFEATAQTWSARLARAGFEGVRVEAHGINGDQTTEIAAQASVASAAAEEPRADVFIARTAGDRFALALARAFARRGARCALASRDDPEEIVKRKPEILVWLTGSTGDNPVARVEAECLALKAMLSSHVGRTLHVIAALDGTDPPFAAAISSFLRTVANEMPSLDIRRVEVFARDDAAAEKLAAVVASSSDEADISLRAHTTQTLRFGRPRPSEPTVPRSMARRLTKSPEGGFDRLSWAATPRRSPGAGEVEVEVIATGLNFRDVMWALSVLPDEMLEGGFAGPTLGLEFSGRVVATGDGVEDLRQGDFVLGLAGGAFSTHLTVDRRHLARIPDGLSCEAAATIPVAFLTAWHGLIGCANLQKGEWALIHGGAGGVGLAALQIVRSRGARAIVTAGSDEKRALAIALGAEHAFDSRSSAFCDGVTRATDGRGVAVVVNSLAGELMERSIDLLEPFGRFIELGKRDYLADTPMGLRPFRQNLSYFGVDLDQMLRERPEPSRRLLGDVLQGFASGNFTPLPYLAFDATDTVEAMRLMQQSAHVGKILVRPPATVARTQATRNAFSVDPKRAHLVTGGLGGFGIETARWLVARGARRLVLVGRSGAGSDGARRSVAELEGQGAEVRVEALDIGDRGAAADLFTRLARDGWSLAGVIHAAMVLDDAIVANLEKSRLLAVLRPKIAGAENLDWLTRASELDYFILFSSATTLIGNPGQGAYVAANGYLEGLARRRRVQGLPALAVAWGAIADAGAVARSAATRDSLAARAGVRGMEARTALDLMADALRHEPSDDGVFVIADVNWSGARAKLKGLEQPAYRRLFAGLEADDAEGKGALNLQALVAARAPEEARRAIADLVTEELARILRLPRDEVSRSKPLSDIGLDSLMAVELALALESRLGLQAPLGEPAGAFNVMTLAQRILSSEIGDGLASNSLAARHLDDEERQGVVQIIERLGEAPSRGRIPPPASDAAE